MTPLLQVALGGALGASLRYLSGRTATRLLGHEFPYGTIFVNIVGSLAMGVLVVVLAEKGGNRLAPLLMTGLLGGFTTFSAFSLDAVFLFEKGQVATAAAYVLLSVGLSIAALVAGLWLARGVLT